MTKIVLYLPRLITGNKIIFNVNIGHIRSPENHGGIVGK